MTPARSAASDEVEVRMEAVRETKAQASASTLRPRRRTLVQLARSQRTILRTNLLGFCLVLAVLAAMIPIVILGNEISKETKVESHAVLTSRDSGDIVKVDTIHSFADMWDLPSFDSETLSTLSKITLLLTRSEGDMYEATFHVVGALRRLQAHSRAVSLLTADGGEITVDAKTYVAVASISGRTYVINGIKPVGKRAAGAFAEEEFFTASRGFATSGAGRRRRLQADSPLVGYVSFALQAAKAVLENANTVDGPVTYSSVYIHGKLTDVIEQRTVDLKVLYNSSYVSNATTPTGGGFILMTEAGVNGVLTSLSRSLDFVYNSEHQLVDCRKTAQPDASTALPLVDTAATGAVADVASDGRFTLVVHTTVLDPPTIPNVFEVPEDEECHALAALQVETPPLAGTPFVNPEQPELPRAMNESRAAGAQGGRARRLALHGTVSYDELWKAARGTYKKYSPEGWYSLWTCEASNAYARFMYKVSGPNVVVILGFSGSDDALDWVNNFNLFPRTEAFSPAYRESSGTVHGGFVDYVQSLSSCLAQYRSTLLSWGYPLSYIVGHSLGGASATVYTQLYGPAVYGVATFGAPKTRLWASCSVAGMRFFHDDDVVTSNFPANILSSWSHDVSGAYMFYDETYCAAPTCVWGACTCLPWNYGMRKRGTGTNCGRASSSNYDLVNLGKHSAYGEYTSCCV